MFLPRFLFLYFLLLFSIPSYSQLFGEVDISDFTVDEKYKDADAVILADQGQSTFYENNGSLDIRFIRTRRILILTKTGLDYGDVSIHYYQDGYNRTEIVEDIEAATYYVKEGTLYRERFNPDEVYEEEIDEEWKAKKFAMPKVQEGVIIEYKYTLKTPFKFNLPDWQFQHRVPTKYSSYEVRMVPFYEYAYFLQGASSFDEHQSYVSKGMERQFGLSSFKDMVHIYTMKDIPAFEDESYITTPEDYLIKLDFQLAKIHFPTGGSKDIYTTWEDLCDEFLKHEDFGKWLKQAENQAEKILKDNVEFTTSSNKIEWIVNYLKIHFEWNGNYRRYTDSKVKDFLDSRIGNSTELNLFLVAMFRAAGFDADVILISTRNHGRINDSYPIAAQFNSTLCLVKSPSGLLLTDGTEDWLPYNSIPPKDINGKGLIVRKEKVAWVNLNGSGKSMDMVNFTWSIRENNTLAGDVRWMSTGYDAYNSFKRFNDNPAKFTSYLEAQSLAGIEDLHLSDPSEGISSFGANCKAKSSYEDLGNSIMFSPFAEFPPATNEFKYPGRKYPVDMIYAKSRIYSCKLVIPEGYTLSEVPENKSMVNDLIVFRYNTILVNNELQIKGELQFLKSVYTPSEYPSLRSAMIVAVKKLNEKIILAKNQL